MANDLPLRYDIEVRQRATFRERIQIPLDCTNREIEASCWQVLNGLRTQEIIQFAIEWTDRAKVVEVPQEDGTTVETIYADFNLMATHEQTTGMETQGVWDLLVIEPNGERTFWMEGIARLNPGMTSGS